MKIIKLAAALGLGVTLSACGAPDMVTRDAPFSVAPGAQGTATTPVQNASVIQAAAPTATAPAQASLPQNILSQINVAKINVTVPQRLRVSEANRYYPNGDIVWRGDPIGDRHAQVATIMNTAINMGTAQFRGPVDVVLDIEVKRFHALSEKARYTVGGVHNVIFEMVLRDAKTGQALSKPQLIESNLDAFGGQQAIDAEARGNTQKVRITNHLAEVIRQQIARPEGYTDANMGFFQAINNI